MFNQQPAATQSHCGNQHRPHSPAIRTITSRTAVRHPGRSRRGPAFLACHSDRHARHWESMSQPSVSHTRTTFRRRFAGLSSWNVPPAGVPRQPREGSPCPPRRPQGASSVWRSLLDIHQPRGLVCSQAAELPACNDATQGRCFARSRRTSRSVNIVSQMRDSASSCLAADGRRAASRSACSSAAATSPSRRRQYSR